MPVVGVNFCESVLAGTGKVKCISGAKEVILEGTGHIGLVTRPAQFAKVVCDFVDQHALRGHRPVLPLQVAVQRHQDRRVAFARQQLESRHPGGRVDDVSVAGAMARSVPSASLGELAVAYRKAIGGGLGDQAPAYRMRLPRLTS